MSQTVFYLTTPIYYPNAAPHLGSAEHATCSGENEKSQCAAHPYASS